MARCVTFAVARIHIGNRRNFAHFSLWHPKYGRQGIQKSLHGFEDRYIYLPTKFGCDRSIVVGCRSQNDRQTDKQNGMTIRLTLCDANVTQQADAIQHRLHRLSSVQFCLCDDVNAGLVVAVVRCGRRWNNDHIVIVVIVDVGNIRLWLGQWRRRLYVHMFFVWVSACTVHHAASFRHAWALTNLRHAQWPRSHRVRQLSASTVRTVRSSSGRHTFNTAGWTDVTTHHHSCLRAHQTTHRRRMSSWATRTAGCSMCHLLLQDSHRATVISLLFIYMPAGFISWMEM